MMRNLIEKKATATDVVSRDMDAAEVNTDAGAFARVGWIVVLLGVCGFLLWAVLAPLDKGVPMPGTVTKEGNRKAIQHATGGTIDDILVKDGDVVKAGQVLVRMNKVTVGSQADAARSQYFTARSMEARLLAERDGKPAISFPPALQAYRQDERAQSSFALQQQLFSARRQASESELGAIDENLAGIAAQLSGLQESRDSKKVQLSILKEQLDNMRDLAKDGYVARSRLLDLERTYAQVGGAISEDIGNIGRAQRQIMELRLRKLQRIQEIQKEVRGQLAETQRDAQNLMSRLEGFDYEVRNAEVKSPVDGIVVGSNIFTRGGVIGAGAKMMEVVPSADAFVVEGQLPVNLIDRVHPNLAVELMFSAFNSNSTPHIAGVVTQVSADRSVEERTGQPYYKVRAIVTVEGMKMIALHKLDIRPGMPVEMFVKTGERTMMSYLLKPVIDRSKSALTEE